MAGVSVGPPSNEEASAGQQTRPFTAKVGRSASSRKTPKAVLVLEVKDAPRRVVICPPGSVHPGAPCVRLSIPLKFSRFSATV